jgi:hypothetical protein
MAVAVHVASAVASSSHERHGSHRHPQSQLRQSVFIVVFHPVAVCMMVIVCE